MTQPHPVQIERLQETLARGELANNDAAATTAHAAAAELAAARQEVTILSFVQLRIRCTRQCQTTVGFQIARLVATLDSEESAREHSASTAAAFAKELAMAKEEVPEAQQTNTQPRLPNLGSIARLVWQKRMCQARPPTPNAQRCCGRQRARLGSDLRPRYFLQSRFI
jgi:hypothetical protein